MGGLLKVSTPEESLYSSNFFTHKNTSIYCNEFRELGGTALMKAGSPDAPNGETLVVLQNINHNNANIIQIGYAFNTNGLISGVYLRTWNNSAGFRAWRKISLTDI
mgnify:CR=1 FL=1